eukprot:810531-Amphidinium_carterae.1
MTVLCKCANASTHSGTVHTSYCSSGYGRFRRHCGVSACFHSLNCDVDSLHAQVANRTCGMRFNRLQPGGSGSSKVQNAAQSRPPVATHALRHRRGGWSVVLWLALMSQRMPQVAQPTYLQRAKIWCVTRPNMYAWRPPHKATAKRTTGKMMERLAMM